MKKSALIFLLASALSVQAQNWEWERQEVNIWNPTSFPHSFKCIGDFNGDGSPDLFERNSNDDNFVIYEFVGDQEHLRWESSGGSQDFVADFGSKHYAADLDENGSDELIIWNWGSPHCWKAVCFDPWIWEARDNLIAAPFLPDTAGEAIWGDFNGNGILNAFFVAEDPWGDPGDVVMYEWDENEGWLSDTGFTGIEEWGVFTGAFEGDYDLDGDRDFALEISVWDSDPIYYYFTNSGTGIAGPVDSLFYTHPVGGDLDSDGDWDFISRYSINGASLETFSGPVIGRLHTAVGGQIFGIESSLHYDWISGYWGYSRERYYTENGWAATSLGLSTGSLYYSVSSEDMNGDQQDDLLLVSINPSVFNLPPHLQPNPSWYLYLNSEDPNEDHFASSGVSFESMAQNPDNTFSSPQIGNIRDEDHKELFVFAESGSNRQLLIYEFQQFGGAESIVLRPDWTNGLPEELNNFKLADIDNDGQSELFTHIGSGQWAAYFQRFGTWQNYDILPDIDYVYMYPLDFDGDGDLDIAGNDEVWLSQSPSAAEERDHLLPSAYQLAAYPNPFNPLTNLVLSVPTATRTTVSIYNVRGQLVQRLFEGVLAAGEHSLPFEAAGLPSGVYLATVTGDYHPAVQKLMLLR